jgi:DNA-directed RNA polymerase specialized sigma24 family protein
MSPTGSVTTWIGQLQSGEEIALARLHDRYWPYLVAMARKKLKGVPGRSADEEDIAQEALWSFYRRMRDGREFQLGSRHDLLALLTHIIACKAVNQLEREATKKRGGVKVRNQSGLKSLSGRTGPGAGRTPLEEALLNDCYRHYVDALPENLRGFAELYLAGCTHKETAERMGTSLRSVERKIAMILERWREMAAESMVQELESEKPP